MIVLRTQIKESCITEKMENRVESSFQAGGTVCKCKTHWERERENGDPIEPYWGKGAVVGINI